MDRAGEILGNGMMDIHYLKRNLRKIIASVLLPHINRLTLTNISWTTFVKFHITEELSKHIMYTGHTFCVLVHKQLYLPTRLSDSAVAQVHRILWRRERKTQIRDVEACRHLRCETTTALSLDKHFGPSPQSNTLEQTCLPAYQVQALSLPISLRGF